MDIPLPDYVDDGALREQDKVPLAAFLARRDRARTKSDKQPFFSGREEEINAFRSMASDILLDGEENATLVVEGPPGAGKSALLGQFKEEMKKLRPVGDNQRRWLPVFLDGGQACSPSDIMRNVDLAISESPAAPLHEKRIRESWRTAKRFFNRGPSVLGVSAGKQEAERPPATISELAERRQRQWAKWQIVLLIDEAQGISPDAPGADPNTLAVIHQGKAGLPMSFCAFGLPGTRDALDNVRVSRTSVTYGFRLGSLDGNAAKMAIRRCFTQYGVTNAQAWEDAIHARSANWPQHLSAHLNAALTILKENAGSPELLGDAQRSSLREAIELGDEWRRRYYSDRIGRLTRYGRAAYREYAEHLVAPLRASPHGLKYRDIMSLLKGGEPRPSHEQVDDFLYAAIHSGFLALDDETGLYAMPIPSFASHLLGEPLTPILDPSPQDALKS